MTIYTHTLAQHIQHLEDRRYSSVELTQCYLDRIREFDSKINSFLTVCPELALAQAKASDARRAAGQLIGPLDGIPIAQKDIFCTRGIRTTCGSKMLENFTPPYDATVVSHLADAGTILLGKVNMDEFAMGSSNENSAFGTCSNPWDLKRVPGGSSGGSAAAVAARLTPFATGTDTGGSIRQPAALCGITGLKPTYGRVSRFGMIAFASSLDTAGPLTATAKDAAYVLQAIAGHDPNDMTSAIEPVPDYVGALGSSINGLKVGLPESYFSKGLSEETAARVRESIAVLESLGATVHPIDLPLNDLSIPTYYVLASSECSSNLARYDGIHYGYTDESATTLEAAYQNARNSAFGPEVKRRIMMGTFALSSGHYDAYYGKAQKAKRLIHDSFEKALKTVDCIAGPTVQGPAFKIGEKVDDPVSMYLNDIYTISVNLSTLPAISIPAGFDQGLPVGLQLIGPCFSEDRLLNIAHQYQQATDWHAQLPEDYA